MWLIHPDDTRAGFESDAAAALYEIWQHLSRTEHFLVVNDICAGHNIYISDTRRAS